MLHNRTKMMGSVSAERVKLSNVISPQKLAVKARNQIKPWKQ
jgi:hypothetical protein